jgi:hypothetical protein
MTRFETVQITESYRDHCEARVAVINDGDRTIIVVADGAGGVGDGDLAAETVIREIQSEYSHIKSASEWDAELKQIDCRIGTGESTAVILDLRPDGIFGSSVGDSQAWIVHDADITDLTIHQKRKPLLGSRNASPVGFSHPALDGMLIVATDGFFNYLKRPQLPAMLAQRDFFEIPRARVEMVRLPSGDLWDDIGLVACRVRQPPRTRKRYTI